MTEDGVSPGQSRFGQGRRAAVCLLVLATGAWYLLRGLAYGEAARIPWLAPWSMGPAATRWLDLVAVATGAGLLVAAAALGDGRPWGWLLGALLGLVACGLALAVWAASGSPDWMAVLLALATTIALAVPVVRMDYLGRR